MGRADYQLWVNPCSNSPLAKAANDKTAGDVLDIVNIIQAEWPQVSRDPTARVIKEEEAPLVYETEKEIFQILVRTSYERDHIYVSVRYAYYNPTSIHLHVCNFIVWLMKRFDMYCSPGRPLISPDSGEVLDPYAIEDANKVAEILVPSMEHMQRLWRLMAGAEERKLRPEEARAYLRSQSR